jgi:secreted trypsin-like serine protease
MFTNEFIFEMVLESFAPQLSLTFVFSTHELQCAHEPWGTRVLAEQSIKMKLAQVGAFASIVLAAVKSAYGYELSRSRATIAGLDANTSSGLPSNQESRIYGGSEADVNQYPFIASLRFDPEGKTFCGGTLVDPHHILTAGHCIKTDKGQIYVSLGSEFGSGEGSGSAEQIKVVEGFRHPLFNNDKHLYDVGLLRLETPSALKPAPLCAADGSDNKIGTVGTVLGWGLTEDRRGSFTLQEVNVQIISNAACDKQYGGGKRITEAMMCAGDGGGKDSCNGDSGGPLLADDKLVGLVSWGGECGVKAGVYTRLAFVMDYINDVLGGATDSLFPASSSEPSSSSEEDDNGSETKSPATDAPAADASTEATLGSLSSASTSGGSVMSMTAPSSPSLPPTTQSSSSQLAVPTNEVPASGQRCGIRRRRLSSKKK